MSTPSLDKPLLVYDGDCSFCRLWVDRWKSLASDRVDFAPFQEVAAQFSEIPSEDFRKSVQLLEPGKKVVTGAEAVFTVLHLTDRSRWLLWSYRRIPGFSSVSEFSYRYVANRRDTFYKLTRLLWGKNVQRPTYYHTQWVFLRGMGLIYLVAFLSLATQIRGLVGSQGILPAQQFLSVVYQEMGPTAYRLLPTLAWLNAGDGFLSFLCVSGVILSLMLIVGFLERVAAVLLWIFYFSLYIVGQEFLSFQWDILLLETGFLTIFFSQWRVLPGRSGSPPSTAILWLIRLLLFRLMFQSGVVKLTSGDPTWLNLTALSFHYETQCIPTPIAWYAYQLPLWFQQLSVAVMFFIEIGVPFLIFLPRRPRMLGAWLLIAFQMLIILTGNYAFFNYLTIVLCLSLFDDAAIRRVLWRRSMVEPSQGKLLSSVIRPSVRVSFFLVMVILNILSIAGLFVGQRQMPDAAASLIRWSSAYNVVNGYGLFRVMTTSHPEIIVEGSDDGTHWSAYEFKYKPGDTLRSPPWVAPHQPRLDWQMWFAALGSYRENRWFVNFMVQLLQGSPDVLALLGRNPFAGKPLRYVRALLYDYHFTNAARRQTTGAYWQRKYEEVYLPAISLHMK